MAILIEERVVVELELQEESKSPAASKPQGALPEPLSRGLGGAAVGVAGAVFSGMVFWGPMGSGNDLIVLCMAPLALCAAAIASGWTYGMLYLCKDDAG